MLTTVGASLLVVSGGIYGGLNFPGSASAQVTAFARPVQGPTSIIRSTPYPDEWQLIAEAKSRAATNFAKAQVTASPQPTHTRIPTPTTTPSTPSTQAPQNVAPTYAPSTPAATPSSSTPEVQPTTATPTTQAPAPGGSGLGAQLLAQAERMQGVPYVYGGDTPSGFDCSGLVFWAAGQMGITLPRDTYGMLGGSSHLEVVSSPEPGDLAFFGSGHVELYVSSGEFFGAQQTGTVVGFHNYGSYYTPSEYLRVI